MGNELRGFEDFHVSADGSLYAIDGNQGIQELVRNEWEDFLPRFNDPFGHDSEYRTVMSYQNQLFYVGSWRKGMTRYDRQTGTWTRLPVDIPEVQDDDDDRPVTVMEMAMGPDGTVYALTTGDGGALRSTDRGETWESMGDFDPVGLDGVLFPTEDVLLAGKIYRGAGLFRWVDGSWKSVRSDCELPGALRSHPDGYIVAACAKGIFLSADRGKSFAPVSEGLTAETIETVAVSRDGILFFGDRGGTMYRGRLQSQYEK